MDSSQNAFQFSWQNITINPDTLCSQCVLLYWHDPELHWELQSPAGFLVDAGSSVYLQKRPARMPSPPMDMRLCCSSTLFRSRLPVRVQQKDGDDASFCRNLKEVLVGHLSHARFSSNPNAPWFWAQFSAAQWTLPYYKMAVKLCPSGGSSGQGRGPGNSKDGPFSASWLLAPGKNEPQPIASFLTAQKVSHRLLLYPLPLPLFPSSIIFVLRSHRKSGKSFAGIAFPLSPSRRPAPRDRSLGSL